MVTIFPLTSLKIRRLAYLFSYLANFQFFQFSNFLISDFLIFLFLPLSDYVRKLIGDPSLGDPI